MSEPWNLPLRGTTDIQFHPRAGELVVLEGEYWRVTRVTVRPRTAEDERDFPAEGDPKSLVEIVELVRDPRYKGERPGHMVAGADGLYEVTSGPSGETDLRRRGLEWGAPCQRRGCEHYRSGHMLGPCDWCACGRFLWPGLADEPEARA